MGRNEKALDKMLKIVCWVGSKNVLSSYGKKGL